MSDQAGKAEALVDEAIAAGLDGSHQVTIHAKMLRLELLNSLIAGNLAPLGGGIYNRGSVTLNDATSITGNTATAGQGGGVYNEPGSTVTLNDSSLITGNIPDDCFPPGELLTGADTTHPMGSVCSKSATSSSVPSEP